MNTCYNNKIIIGAGAYDEQLMSNSLPVACSENVFVCRCIVQVHRLV